MKAIEVGPLAIFILRSIAALHLAMSIVVVCFFLRIGEIGPLLGPGPAERPTHPHGEVH